MCRLTSFTMFLFLFISACAVRHAQAPTAAGGQNLGLVDQNPVITPTQLANIASLGPQDQAMKIAEESQEATKQFLATGCAAADQKTQLQGLADSDPSKLAQLYLDPATPAQAESANNSVAIGVGVGVGVGVPLVALMAFGGYSVLNRAKDVQTEELGGDTPAGDDAAATSKAPSEPAPTTAETPKAPSEPAPTIAETPKAPGNVRATPEAQEVSRQLAVIHERALASLQQLQIIAQRHPEARLPDLSIVVSNPQVLATLQAELKRRGNVAAPVLPPMDTAANIRMSYAQLTRDIRQLMPLLQAMQRRAANGGLPLTTAERRAMLQDFYLGSAAGLTDGAPTDLARMSNRELAIGIVETQLGTSMTELARTNPQVAALVEQHITALAAAQSPEEVVLSLMRTQTETQIAMLKSLAPEARQDLAAKEAAFKEGEAQRVAAVKTRSEASQRFDAANAELQRVNDALAAKALATAKKSGAQATLNAVNEAVAKQAKALDTLITTAEAERRGHANKQTRAANNSAKGQVGDMSKLVEQTPEEKAARKALAKAERDLAAANAVLAGRGDAEAAALKAQVDKAATEMQSASQALGDAEGRVAALEIAQIRSATHAAAIESRLNFLVNTQKPMVDTFAQQMRTDRPTAERNIRTAFNSMQTAAEDFARRNPEVRMAADEGAIRFNPRAIRAELASADPAQCALSTSNYQMTMQALQNQAMAANAAANKK